jgi:hypothetical protein
MTEKLPVGEEDGFGHPKDKDAGEPTGVDIKDIGATSSRHNRGV